MREPENVAKECPIGFRIAAVEEQMRAENHGANSILYCPFFCAKIGANSASKQDGFRPGKHGAFLADG